MSLSLEEMHISGLSLIHIKTIKAQFKTLKLLETIQYGIRKAIRIMRSSLIPQIYQKSSKKVINLLFLKF